MSFIMQHPISSIYIFGAGFVSLLTFTYMVLSIRNDESDFNFDRKPDGSLSLTDAGLTGMISIGFGVAWPIPFVIGAAFALICAWCASFWLVFKLAKKPGGDGGA